MTSPRQRTLLFGQWRRVCAAAGWAGADADEERLAFTVRHLGGAVSWGQLSNRQVDTLLAAMTAALGGLPLEATDAGAESPEDAARRRRLVFAVERDAAAAYGSADRVVAAMCADFYGAGSPAAAGRWRGLPLGELAKLAATLSHRRRAAANH